MSSNYKRIGDYISQIKIKNKEGKYSELLGINIDKFFMPSVANTVGVNLKNYKIVKKGQFACNRMHVGRDYRIPIALSDKKTPFLVSPAYDVFEITRTEELLPDYLMMWFRRKEYDRNAWYHTDADVRGGLAWEAFCNIKLPVPSIEQQQQIVNEYNTVTNRIKLNEQLNQKLEETAQALYKHWFVDFEFPNEDGKPYKSSGGEMVYNEELDKEIPVGWSVERLTNVLKIFGGGTPKTTVSNYWNGQIPFFTPKDIGDSFYSINTEKNITEEGLKNCSSKLYPKNTIFITARGTVGAVNLAGIEMAMNQSCYAFQEFNYFNYYGHQLALYSMKELIEEATGAVFKALVTKDFEGKIIICPNINVRKNFNAIISPLYNNILLNTEQSKTFTNFQSILLSKMSKVEVEKEMV
ncbi:MAG: restriction endonuclease subunit S [Psychroflexus halocasei]